MVHRMQGTGRCAIFLVRGYCTAELFNISFFLGFLRGLCCRRLCIPSPHMNSSFTAPPPPPLRTHHPPFCIPPILTSRIAVEMVVFASRQNRVANKVGG